MMEAICSSEMSVPTRNTWHHIPQDGSLLNSLTGVGVLSHPDDANRSLALACSDALMHASLLCCLGAHQPKAYL
jgi:hypothetical protein